MELPTERSVPKNGEKYTLRDDDSHFYTIIKPIGQGGFGTVFAAQRSDGVSVSHSIFLSSFFFFFFAE